MDVAVGQIGEFRQWHTAACRCLLCMRKLFQSSFRAALQGVLEGSEVRCETNARNLALASFARD